MILVIKHIEKEGPGSIAEFFNDIKTIELGKGDALPSDFSDIEAVFCMGGPMNVYEEDKYPFLKEEDKFIKLLVEREIPFFGVCLGAQLLAKACGAKVYKADIKEIGWKNIELTDDGLKDPLFTGLPGNLNVLQWHEDTFDAPGNGALLAVGNDVRNQAFRAGSRAYGLQFHIEVTSQMISDWFGTDAHRYKIPDEDKFRKQASRIYKNFLRICAQKLGNPALADKGGVYRRVIDSAEKQLIENTLKKTEGNQIQAAEILGINRNTLRAKIRKLGIKVCLITRGGREYCRRGL